MFLICTFSIAKQVNGNATTDAITVGEQSMTVAIDGGIFDFPISAISEKRYSIGMRICLQIRKWNV